MRRGTSLLWLLAGAGALAGCATPETRLRTGLTDAGISAPVSACMADYMVDHLSIGQLLKLSKLPNLKSKKPDEDAVAFYLKNSRALRDMEIIAVTVTAATRCAI